MVKVRASGGKGLSFDRDYDIEIANSNRVSRYDKTITVQAINGNLRVNNSYALTLPEKRKI